MAHYTTLSDSTLNFSRTSKPLRSLLLICLGVVGFLTSCSENPEQSAEKNTSTAVPATQTNTATPWLNLTTQQGVYQVRVAQDYSTVPAGDLHFWDFDIGTADGMPVVVKRFELTADMPGHGHGMTTFPQPVLTQTAGKIRVEGIKFHMSGNWRMRLQLDGPDGNDKIEFDIVVAPKPVSTANHIKQFSSAEIAQLKALHLSNLPSYAGDPTNRFSQNPAAIKLGAKLFFDNGLSANGDIACASCHQPNNYFSDGKALSMGSALTQRHAPSLLGAAWQRWYYWDGRRDSLWAQAVTPIETIGEMDNTRVDALRFVFNHPEYGPAFEQLTRHDPSILAVVGNHTGVGPLSHESGRATWQALDAPARERINRAYADLGKMLAAYEETLTPAASTLEAFIDALVNENESSANDLLSPAALRGARLFVSNKHTQCLRCHNGPLLTNREFHNIATGMGADKLMDFGRSLGFKEAQKNEFNCISIYSDAPANSCTTLRYVRRSHLDNGAFKTPSLRHVGKTAPYMHDGRYATLRDVVDHYRRPVGDFTSEHEIPPLNISDDDANDLVEFLKIL